MNFLLPLFLLRLLIASAADTVGTLPIGATNTDPGDPFAGSFPDSNCNYASLSSNLLSNSGNLPVKNTFPGVLDVKKLFSSLSEPGKFPGSSAPTNRAMQLRDALGEQNVGSISYKQPTASTPQAQRTSSRTSSQSSSSSPPNNYVYVDDELPHTLVIKHDLSDRLAQLFALPHATVTRRIYVTVSAAAPTLPAKLRHPLTSVVHQTSTHAVTTTYSTSVTHTHSVTATHTLTVTSANTTASTLASTTKPAPANTASVAELGGLLANLLLNVVNSKANTVQPRLPMSSIPPSMFNANTMVNMPKNLPFNGYNGMRNNYEND